VITSRSTTPCLGQPTALVHAPVSPFRWRGAATRQHCCRGLSPFERMLPMIRNTGRLGRHACAHLLHCAGRIKGRMRCAAFVSSRQFFELRRDPGGRLTQTAASPNTFSSPANGRRSRRVGRIRSFRASTVCRISKRIERQSLCPPSRPALADWRSQRPLNPMRPPLSLFVSTKIGPCSTGAGVIAPALSSFSARRRPPCHL